MVNKVDFYELMKGVIASEFPNERDIFDLEGETLIDELYQGNDITQSKATKVGAKPFGEGVVEVLKIVALLWGTYKSVAEIYVLVHNKMTNKEAKTSIADRWTEELKKAGMDEVKASRIVAKFSDDLTHLVSVKE